MDQIIDVTLTIIRNVGLKDVIRCSTVRAVNIGEAH